MVDYQPPNITGASVAVSADYTAIYGLADNLLFYYDAVHHTPYYANYTSSHPAQGGARWWHRRRQLRRDGLDSH